MAGPLIEGGAATLGPFPQTAPQSQILRWARLGFEPGPLGCEAIARYACANARTALSSGMRCLRAWAR